MSFGLKLEIKMPKYEDMGLEIGKLVKTKNKKYGDSFNKSGDIIRILYPNGIKPEEYDDLLGIIRVLDKMFRIATDRDALGESPWEDIAGYSILRTVHLKEVKK